MIEFIKDISVAALLALGAFVVCVIINGVTK